MNAATRSLVIVAALAFCLGLLPQVENQGPAPASAATFEPADFEIEMLMPGGVFPEGKGIHWVADTTAAGGSRTCLHRLVYANEGATEQRNETYIAHEGKEGNVENVKLTNQAGEGCTVPTRDGLESGQHPFDARLHRDSQIELVAPRESDSQPPSAHTAYVVPLDDGCGAVTCASDYDGIDKVVFIDRHGNGLPMQPDRRGPWFLSCLLNVSIVYTVGTPITPNAPTVTNTVTSYAISPALPPGLTIHPTSGVINGEPTATSAAVICTITASNSAGATTAAATIEVN